MKNGRKGKSKALLLAVGALAAALIMGAAGNQFGAAFDKLNETDRYILSEYDAFCKSGAAVWEGYALDQKTILAVGKHFGKAYLINPTEPVSGLFAKRIQMPEGSALTVYRISRLAPGLLPYRVGGNFNTIGQARRLYGNDVYYIKYDRAQSVEQAFSSGHFITLLGHEAFHYYMQNNWAGGERIFADLLTEADMGLLNAEYEALARIQTELLKAVPDEALLLQGAAAYADAVSRHAAANPALMQALLSMETAEGAATYVGIRASKAVGYDFGVMYFDNAKNVPISDVLPTLESGALEKTFLLDRMPYETGALLCELLDALHVPGWQAALNRQTLEQPATLVSVLADYLAAKAPEALSGRQ